MNGIDERRAYAPRHYSVPIEVSYTAQEAITLIGVYGHWGPWN